MMWLGSAQFDLAQGGHLQIADAIESYRQAQRYVDLADDEVLRAKFDSNLANVLIKSPTSVEVVEEAVARYQRALPVLERCLPSHAPQTEAWLSKSRSLLDQLRDYSRRRKEAVGSIRDLVAGLSTYSLDRASLLGIQARLQRIIDLGNPAEVGEMMRGVEEIQRGFQELMEIVRTADSRRTGGQAPIVQHLIALWQTLVDQALALNIDTASRDRAGDLAQRIIDRVTEDLDGASPEEVRDLEASRLRALALDARQLLYRHHLSWASPIWTATRRAPDANGVYLTEGPLRGALEQACRDHGLEVLGPEPGQNVAQSHYDAIRRSTVVVVHLVGDPPSLAAGAYALGIALVLGRPVVVLAAPDFDVPFNIDVQPVRTADDALDEGAFLAALDAAFYLPQRAPEPVSLVPLLEATRRRFPHQTHLLSEFESHIEDPTIARDILGAVLASNPDARAQVCLPAWPRAWPDPDAPPFLFHVTAFHGGWPDQVSVALRKALAGGPMTYLRHDDTNDPSLLASLWRCLCTASFVLVDLTGFNANAALECGVAHALGKPVRVIGQPGVAESRFPALDEVLIHRYDLGDLDGLGSWVRNQVDALTGGGP